MAWIEEPGGRRGLENALSHAFMLATGDVIDVEHLPRFLRNSECTFRKPLPGVVTNWHTQRNQRPPLTDTKDYCW